MNNYLILLISLAIGTQITAQGAGDICGGGYLSSTGRLWTLGSLPLVGNVDLKWLYTLNLCRAFTVPCGSDTAVCQITNASLVHAGIDKWSLGSRTPFPAISEIDDKTISVKFTKGDYCPVPARNREVSITFKCGAYSDFVSITETAACTYAITVAVGDYLCKSGAPITTTGGTTLGPTTAIATTGSTISTTISTTGSGRAYCGSGYVSSTGRIWALSGLGGLTAIIGKYQYALNLCGTSTTNCISSAVMCQADTSDPSQGPYSLGEYSTGVVSSVSDLSISIAFTQGQACRFGTIPRKISITFACAENENTPSAITAVSEIDTCSYYATVFVASSLCSGRSTTRRMNLN